MLSALDVLPKDVLGQIPQGSRSERTILLISRSISDRGPRMVDHESFEVVVDRMTDEDPVLQDPRHCFHTLGRMRKHTEKHHSLVTQERTGH